MCNKIDHCEGEQQNEEKVLEDNKKVILSHILLVVY